MVKYCFFTAWSLTTATDYEQQCTENRHIQQITKPVIIIITRPLTRLQLTHALLDETLTVITIPPDTHTNANSGLAVMTASLPYT